MKAILYETMPSQQRAMLLKGVQSHSAHTYLKALWTVIVHKLGELGIICIGQASFRSHIDHGKDRALVLGHGNVVALHVTVDNLEKGVNLRGNFFSECCAMHGILNLGKATFYVTCHVVYFSVVVNDAKQQLRTRQRFLVVLNDVIGAITSDESVGGHLAKRLSMTLIFFS